MKLIGIMFLILAFSFSGFVFANEYLSVLKGIERIDSFLKNIIFCLKNEHMSISDIFEHIRINSDDETNEFIKMISPELLINADKIAYKCGFCRQKDANSILKDALSIFGRYSAEEQISELEHCRNRIKNIYDKNEEISKNKAKFAQKAGFLCGIFVAVILF